MKKVTEVFAAFTVAALLGAGCASGPMTTREQGAVVGGLGGAAAGGIVGSAVGHPAAGALIGGGLGLGAGALVGDQMQRQEYRNYDQDEEIRRQQYEIDRLRRERDYNQDYDRREY
jgi:outer membrane lipoprotein SlyB